MEILPTVIVGVALAAGFGVMAIIAWQGWRDRHAQLTAAKAAGRRTL